MKSLNKEENNSTNNIKEFKSSNQMMAFIIGAITLSPASILGITGNISSLMVVSLLGSIGVSSIFHALLGGIEKGEIKMKGPGAIKEVSTNLKISGPIVAFLVVFFGVYYIGERTHKISSKNKNQIETIIEKITMEPSNVIMLDAEGKVHEEIKLMYELEPGSSISDSKETFRESRTVIFEGLEKNILGLKHKPSTDISYTVHDKEAVLGSINSKDILQVLSNIAKKNSLEPKNSASSKNSVTNQIFNDCANLSGVCKMPGVAKVIISFSESLGESEANVCPNSELHSWSNLSFSSLIFTEKINDSQDMIEAKKINKINNYNRCIQSNQNLVELSIKHKDSLFYGKNKNRPYHAYVWFNP